MFLLSCVNCCFNALQYDTVGTPTGYCVEHKKVLRFSENLTCGRHLRKDLPLLRTLREHERHQQIFTPAYISILRERTRANGQHTSTLHADTDVLRKDPVASIVTEYGLLDTKVESLAQLRRLPGARAELARLVLGRTYVRRCVDRGGRWTSGLHLLWWARERLAQEPNLDIADIRTEAAVPLARQVDLAKWSIVMLRLLFISDIGRHAIRAPFATTKVRALADLPELAAAETGVLSLRAILKWVERKAIPLLDHVFPEDLYVRISQRLHKEADLDGAS